MTPLWLMKCKWNWQMPFLRRSFKSDHMVWPLLSSFVPNAGMPQLESVPSALPLEWKCHRAELQPSHDGRSTVGSHYDFGVVSTADFIMSWLTCLAGKGLYLYAPASKFSDLVEMPLSLWSLPDVLPLCILALHCPFPSFLSVLQL